MSELKKGVDTCASDDCDDPVGVKYTGLCHACHRWLGVWSQRTAAEVATRCKQIRRLWRRQQSMPLPGMNQGQRLKGKLLVFRKTHPRRKAS